MRIDALNAWEVLDSRGLPTVRAECRLEDSSVGTASVPSGKSRGVNEAVELRDGEPGRYGGMGCRRAVAGIEGEIAGSLVGKSFADQSGLDAALIELDGTSEKSRLGTNAILGVSIAYARAVAASQHMPLWRAFATMAENPTPRLPALTVNLFSGGKHAGGQVPIQDVLVVPHADSVDEGLAMVHKTYAAAASITADLYGARPLTADEGGLAPDFPTTTAMLDNAVESIARAGLEHLMSLAIDVAASHFHSDGSYDLGDDALDATGMIGLLGSWAGSYPLVSIEDGLAEDDWEGWSHLRETLGGKTLTLGDDLLCTNPERIRRAIDSEAADALLLKVNQVGTLSEALAALQLARGAGWKVVISARSGETEDDWLADLAVGWSADYIKVGSITQSERLAKYNRLLLIESAAGLPTPKRGPR